jgi:hypothetical protein
MVLFRRPEKEILTLFDMRIRKFGPYLPQAMAELAFAATEPSASLQQSLLNRCARGAYPTDQ